MTPCVSTISKSGANFSEIGQQADHPAPILHVPTTLFDPLLGQNIMLA
jgi:hypothetical protein